MIGARKMTTLDVERLREVFKKEKNNSKIAREFRTLNGEQISREHIVSIRKERRWNDETRSYLMKEDYSDLPQVTTHIKDCDLEEIYTTKVSCVLVPNETSPHGVGMRYLILHYRNDHLLIDERVDLEDEIPSDGDLMRKHLTVVEQYV